MSEEHRHGEQQQGGVLRRRHERGVVEDEAVVVGADEGPAVAPDEPQREVDHARDRVREDEPDQQDRGSDVQVRRPGTRLQHGGPSVGSVAGSG